MSTRLTAGATLLVFLEEACLLLSLAAVQAADDALAGEDLHLALGDGQLLLVAELLDADAVVCYFFCFDFDSSAVVCLYLGEACLSFDLCHDSLVIC